MTKQFAIGIDLHGTLLNRNWDIEFNLIAELKELFLSLTKRCYLYICTGNDLSFVHEYVPEILREGLDGYILENGSAYSNGKYIDLLIDDEQVEKIKSFEQELQNHDLPDVLYYADRLATISLFTKERRLGKDPRSLWKKVSEIVNQSGFGKDFTVSHSDVAVDIYTAGTNKYTGIKSKIHNTPIIAIADSVNDRDFLLKANLSFIPYNSFYAIHNLQQIKSKSISTEGFEIHPLKELNQSKDVPVNIPLCSGIITKKLYQSSFPYTEGLIDSLKIIQMLLYKDSLIEYCENRI